MAYPSPSRSLHLWQFHQFFPAQPIVQWKMVEPYGHKPESRKWTRRAYHRRCLAGRRMSVPSKFLGFTRVSFSKNGRVHVDRAAINAISEFSSGALILTSKSGDIDGLLRAAIGVALSGAELPFSSLAT